MAQGSVKWFNHRKGYGFILAQGRDVFVHYSSIEGGASRSLQEGDLVQYDPVDTPRGPAATHVRVEKAHALAGKTQPDSSSSQLVGECDGDGDD